MLQFFQYSQLGGFTAAVLCQLLGIRFDGFSVNELRSRLFAAYTHREFRRAKEPFGLLCKNILDDPVLQGVEADHRQTPAGSQQIHTVLHRLFHRPQLSIDLDADGLKAALGGMAAFAPGRRGNSFFDQLRELKKFLEDVGGKKISEQSVQRAVANSNEAASYYSSQLALRKDHDPVTSLTNELYAIFMCHLLAGSEESLKYTKMLLEDVKKAPKGEGLHILWMHMMPFLQEPVKDVFNYSQNVHIRACDFVADGFQRMQASDPYEALAEKMVNCIYNGSVKQRIRRAQELASLTEADGGILFAHWGCKGTIGASSLIKNSLENAGLPTMVLDGDGCNPANSSDGQVSTRLQAYLEMLSEGKEEKRS